MSKSYFFTFPTFFKFYVDACDITAAKYHRDTSGQCRGEVRLRKQFDSLTDAKKSFERKIKKIITIRLR